MEKAVTSVALPEVEEIAQKRAFRRSSGRPNTLHISSNVISGYSYLIHIAFAASIGEPPPMRSISSLLPLAAIDKPVSLDEIRETGVGDDIINGLIRLSVIRATDADKTLFPSDSITICRIAKFFHDFGIPLGALRDMMHELRKIVEVETRAFNKYLGDTKSFLSLEERDALIRECIENINTLLPLLHLQLLNSARRRKSQDREKQGPRGA